ncbi:hypothetical protein UF75_0669 [Desulfosporosinus sp. I2]|uniref:PPC domain-containing DNA-binding protein n=1 Tax=Desulfosporosinus sp. I2 TaxID=1617025 RepID=UPI0005EEA125|nr:PPC domain-containing DNA-binding protein [Desulfosporosinus sp. I2]KJR48959.1 hypothetical protein UF75_0669 [Desulfosporosinus sp. I2]
MEYRQFNSKIVLRLDKGEEIIKSIKDLCKAEGISLASVSGIGAVNKANIGLFEQATKVYHPRELTGSMEITSLQGNVSEMGGEVYLHLHVTLTDSTYQAYGGHLNMAWVGATVEIILDVIDGKIDRVKNEEVGLNIIKF